MTTNERVARIRIQIGVFETSCLGTMYLPFVTETSFKGTGKGLCR